MINGCVRRMLSDAIRSAPRGIHGTNLKSCAIATGSLTECVAGRVDIRYPAYVELLLAPYIGQFLFVSV